MQSLQTLNVGFTICIPHLTGIFWQISHGEETLEGLDVFQFCFPFPVED